MARRAHDLHRALDVNGNRTRMRNRAIVCARVCVIHIVNNMCAYMARIADVSGAAAGMQIMRRICGAYAVAVGVIAHELVVACSTG